MQKQVKSQTFLMSSLTVLICSLSRVASCLTASTSLITLWNVTFVTSYSRVATPTSASGLLSRVKLDRHLSYCGILIRVLAKAGKQGGFF